MTQDKNEILKWIENGGKCLYCYGFIYKGATPREISKERALELLPKFSFGMGHYELSWYDENTLFFNEFSENDLY